MGNSHSSQAPSDRGGQNNGSGKNREKYQPPVIGYKHSFKSGINSPNKLPNISMYRCKLNLLNSMRIKDYLEIEKEYVSVQSITKSSEAKDSEEFARVDDIRGAPISVGTLEEIIDENHAIISTSVTSEHYVSILTITDRSQLEPGCQVLLNHKVHAIVGVLNDENDPLVSVMKLEKPPVETYADIGGLDEQIQEIKESVELPLTHPEYYEEMGIKPPKGVILHGPPGTGKTLLVKAVANQTSATFLRVVGSELIQKYMGEGPKLVREMFKMAAENAPSIIFIDEIDAIGTKRFDSNSGGEREIQRTMLELLNQLDGFDYLTDVKVIMATNRIETLDPALIRPGRIDRKIQFSMPDVPTKMRIFRLHTGKMTLDRDVDPIEYLQTKENLSGADIKAMCTEAGMIALRERRLKVTHSDFKKAKQVILHLKKDNTPEGMYI
ncbi:MAG: 26S proteasome regulatory subunit 4 [Marteilia pararefringens]